MTSRFRRGASVLALLALSLLPGLAAAQGGPGGSGPGRTTVTLPLQDLPSGDTLTERAGRLWSGFLSSFGFGPSAASIARGHDALQRHAQSPSRDDFTALMDMAGYQLAEINSTHGLIPSLTLVFGQARQLTESDREYVERAIERHARRNPGPVSSVQRAIVRGVIEAADIGDFSVDRLEVQLYPLPSVRIAAAPADAPMTQQARTIMRAIEQLSARVDSIVPPRNGMSSQPIPQAMPRPIRPVAVSQ